MNGGAVSELRAWVYRVAEPELRRARRYAAAAMDEARIATMNAEIDDAYRAIGRYVAVFSGLISEMRSLLSDRIGKADSSLVNIVLGQSQPMAIVDAFFGLCKLVGELDDDEAKIASLLSSRVGEVVKRRNDVAHGDWHIGIFAFDESGRFAFEPSRLIRIHPNRREGPFKVEDLATADIDAMTNDVVRLIADVVEFGKLALGVPVLRRDTNGQAVVSRGEVRVRDVLVFRSEGKNAPSDVVREGPLAAEVSRIPYVW